MKFLQLAPRRHPGGFTLVELLIVMSVIGILAAISVPSYKRSLVKAREAVLMEDLYQMRRAADAFYADNARYPDSLEDLVNSKYLRGAPQDPFTNDNEWDCLPPEASDDGELAPGGCFDFRSLSDLVGLNGIPYSEW
ncbi:type IV pilin protein [Trichloromonas sp.]|uniref:type IV pilin protein n=1 Tax=Trichloromonas sp. TaxID=3069249 RepID=UPI003D817874